jgi:hypothetical protein
MIQDEGIKKLALNVVLQAVEEWKELCRGHCKKCGGTDYTYMQRGYYISYYPTIYTYMRGGYVCNRCGTCRPDKPKLENGVRNFTELEKFFTDGTCELYLSGSDVDHEKLWSELKKRKKRAQKLKVAY